MYNEHSRGRFQLRYIFLSTFDKNYMVETRPYVEYFNTIHIGKHMGQQFVNSSSLCILNLSEQRNGKEDDLHTRTTRSLLVQTFRAFFDGLPPAGSCIGVLCFSGVLLEGRLTRTRIDVTSATNMFLLLMKKWVKVKQMRIKAPGRASWYSFGSMSQPVFVASYAGRGITQ